MAIPNTERKLVIPPHFVSYLEKHRVHNLFYDMTTALAMTMPDDHILYLRNLLVEMGTNSGRARIMIIGPHMIDKKSLAKAVGHLLKLPVISLCDFAKGDKKLVKNAEQLASTFKSFLQNKRLIDEGWILYDYPSDRSEVTALQKIGIRPSHAFQLIPSPENIAERDLWNESFIGKRVDELVDLMNEYRQRLAGMRPTVKNVLKEIPLHRRSLEQVAKSLAILGRQSHHRGGPSLPRVVLIGTRGSFKQTVACKMAEKMGIVHVNMDELIAQTLLQDNQLGRELRELESRNVRIYGKLVVAVLENRLLDYDCLNKGWVLTGFPRDARDLAALDMFDTRPNRVIFITNNSLEALERLKNRRINLYTGEYRQQNEIDELEDRTLAKQYVIHPDDDLREIIKQQTEFDENVQGMLDYCKDDCIVVDGTGGLDSVVQRVFKFTLQAPPTAEPRGTNEPFYGAKVAEKTLKTEGAELVKHKAIIDSKTLDTADQAAEAQGSNIDSTKPICFRTSFDEEITKNQQEEIQMKDLKQLKPQESCQSVFPGKIREEWNKMRAKPKSYTSLPPDERKFEHGE
ncbi:adenylate kinase 8 [Nesidiocoris tenuis]|uniref:Adenylate kinase 8 n=1 Tax=Nesidiocoris tenuis TaxID=355587 RepID=A0ABN7AM59_9HEMI|nr:adenylate kinase 8 [Nesidiocoris tenuis]